MRKIAVRYSKDVIQYELIGVYGFYEVLRNLPYKYDPVGLELLKRPALTLQGIGPGGDCDDKAIAMAALLFRLNIPFRFVAGARNAFFFAKNGKKVASPLHHTWVQGYINDRYTDMDPTYYWNSFGNRIGKWHKVVIIG